MALTLLLRLPPPGQAETDWLLVDETGAAAGPRQHGSLTLAAAVAGSARVIALAPATQVLLAEPVLPPGSGVKLVRAVPFALEEQLTEDIDQLYFAVGRRTARGGTSVAVVSVEIIRGWLADLRAAGIEPAAIYADMALLPENPGQTVLWLEQNRLVVRRPGSLPFAVEITPVAEALLVAGVVADPDDVLGEPKVLENAILYLNQDDWQRVEGEFEGLTEKFASLKVQLLADGPLPWFARELNGKAAVNLLQGEFAAEADYGARWRRWRIAALLALGLLSVHIVAQALQIHQANRRAAELDAQIAQVFSATMPTERLQDPRRQMQARLERIRKSAAGPQYLLHAMQTLGGALAQQPKTRIDALSYREQTIDMKLTAPSIDALSQLSQAMAKQGLSAEIQSSTPTSGGVDAHMQIRLATTRKHP